MAPTRELAQQIQKVVIALGDYMGAQCHACIGGTSVREDMRKLDAGQHIVVGKNIFRLERFFNENNDFIIIKILSILIPLYKLTIIIYCIMVSPTPREYPPASWS